MLWWSYKKTIWQVKKQYTVCWVLCWMTLYPLISKGHPALHFCKFHLSWPVIICWETRLTDINQVSCKIFRNSFYEIRSWHQNGKCTNYRKYSKGYQAESVNHRGSKLPFTADGFTLIMVPEAPGDELQLLQNLAHFRGAANQEPILCIVLSVCASDPTTRNARVIAWRAAGVLHGVIANVDHATIAGTLPGYSVHLHTADDVLPLLIVPVRYASLSFPRLLHSEKPCTPVQQYHSHLSES